MLAIFLIVLPIFALIFAGWAIRRIGVLGPQASSELNRFVVYLALPALLFDIVAKAHWSEIWQPAFVAAFGIGSAVAFAAAIALRFFRPRHLADAAVDGLNAAYPNTGFIGFPLAAAVFGPASLAPTLIATIFTVCVLFAFALILIEFSLQAERRPHRMVARVMMSLARNPLLVAPAAGAVFLAFGFSVPAPVDRFMTLLGDAASPCALVALGLFLADKRESAGGDAGTISFLVTAKLVVQPLVTWLVASRLLHMTPELTRMAVLIAALPTGTGSFMVAEFYRREAGITSRTILFSTIASIVTITLYLSISS